jgi:TolB-like protein
VHHSGETPTDALPRLAIMPFVTGHTVPEHLGPVIAEETITRLSGAPEPVVSVLARDSIFTLAQHGYSAQQVGAKLKADLVLAGTLRTLTSHFRLRVEMIRVADGTQIWVEDLLVPHNRIAGLETELVQQLTFRLNTGSLFIPKIADPFAERRVRPERREAYEAFQQARYEWQSPARHRMQDGLQQLTLATKLDPMLIPAQVDYIHACITQTIYGFMASSVANDNIHRILESIPSLPEQAETIVPALGWAAFHIDHDLPAALKAFSLSAHLPHDPWTTRSRVFFALSRHRFDEALVLLHAALQVDPFSPRLHARLIWALHLAGENAKSVEQSRRALTLFPDHNNVLLYSSMVLSFNGDTVNGVNLAEKLIRQSPYLDLATSTHAYALICAGRKEEAHEMLEQLQWLNRERYVLHSFAPAAMLALKDRESTLIELHSALEQRSPWFFQMLADPRLKDLAGDPEFDKLKAVLTRMEESVKGHKAELEL